MDVFELRDTVIGEYRQFVTGYLNVRDERIRDALESALDAGRLWPDPYVSLNPKFAAGRRVDELAGHYPVAAAWRQVR